MARPALEPGRLLEPVSNYRPRRMIVHDRTRLIDRLNKFKMNLQVISWQALGDMNNRTNDCPRYVHERKGGLSAGSINNASHLILIGF